MVKVYINGRGKMGEVCRTHASSLSNEFIVVDKIEDAQVVVDFSSERGLSEMVDKCLVLSIPLVSGTTGYSEVIKNKVNMARRVIKIVVSPNFSSGMNFILESLNLLKPDTIEGDIKINEVHEETKKDSPSGTAKKLEEVIFKKTNKHADIYPYRVPESHGVIEVCGEHDIEINGKFERIRIFHEVKSRTVFADGALKIAKGLVIKNG